MNNQQRKETTVNTIELRLVSIPGLGFAHMRMVEVEVRGGLLKDAVLAANYDSVFIDARDTLNQPKTSLIGIYHPDEDMCMKNMNERIATMSTDVDGKIFVGCPVKIDTLVACEIQFGQALFGDDRVAATGEDLCAVFRYMFKGKKILDQNHRYFDLGDKCLYLVAFKEVGT